MKDNIPSGIYSASQLKMYQLCPLRYRFRYIDQLKPSIQHIESFVGCRVHESIEYLYECIKEDNLLSIGQLVTYYRKEWELQWSRSLRFTHPEHGREWYRRFGEKCLRHYYATNYPFEDKSLQWFQEEWSFLISLDRNANYQLRGQLDRLEQKDEAHFIIHDYKTAKYVPSLEKLNQDIQPALYQLAVWKTFPEAKTVEVQWHYLAARRTLSPSLSKKELDQFNTVLFERIDQIEKSRKEQVFEAKPSPVCRWCDYQNFCPAFEQEKQNASSGSLVHLFTKKY